MEEGDLTEPWYISDDIPLEIDTSFTTLVSRRKMKRITPESDKDQRYWNKRKRNNVAAKKSRENKRKVEFAIRNKVLSLVEENAIMKREVSLMKAKMGIDPNTSILTDQERDKCIRSAQLAFQNNLDFKKVRTKLDSQNIPQGNDENVSSSQEFSHEDQDAIQHQNVTHTDQPSFSTHSENISNLPVYANFVDGHWAQTSSINVSAPPPAHSSPPETLQNTGEGIRVMQYNNIQVGYEQPQTPPSTNYFVSGRQITTTFQARADYPCIASGPADLSIRNKSTESEQEKLTHTPATITTQPLDHLLTQKKSSLQSDDNIMAIKLLQLSAQVEEMKSLILKQT